MRSRQIIGTGTAVILITLAGCAGPKSPNDKTGAPIAATQPTADAAPAPADADATAQALLARKTAEYAQGMQTAMEHRTATDSATPPSPAAPAPAPAQPAAAVAPPTPAASIVQWLDPDEFRISPFPAVARSSPRHEDAAPVQPVVDTTPPKPVNQTAPPAPAKTQDANLPASVPEGQDRVPPAPSSTAAAPQVPLAESSDELQRKLAKQIRDYPRDVAGHLDYQLLRFVQDQPTPDMSAIAPLPGEDREIITALMDGLSNFRETVRADNNLLLSKKIRPIIDMADRLRSQAELTIPTITLCSQVATFGVYTTMDSRFSAGREHPVIVYCEVENFASTQDEKKMWTTKLSQEAVLYTETGMPVWPLKSSAIPVVDSCHNRRHDFFVTNIVRLPGNLSIGRYLLKVTLVDQQANRVAEATTPIEIIAE